MKSYVGSIIAAIAIGLVAFEGNVNAILYPLFVAAIGIVLFLSIIALPACAAGKSTRPRYSIQRADKPLTIVGDGEQVRDFTFCTDVARAFLAGRIDLTRAEAVLAGQKLTDACPDDGCVTENALYLADIARALDQDAEAEAWLRMAHCPTSTNSRRRSSI